MNDQDFTTQYKCIAIVGSRDYPDWTHVTRYVDKLPWATVVISGGARGVDTVAVRYAAQRSLMTEVYKAYWNLHGKAAGMIRNQKIVDAADKVVAFWDGKSRGTADTIAKARKAGKPCEVYVAVPEDGQWQCVLQDDAL